MEISIHEQKRGSGKTENLAKDFKEAYAKNQNTICLVPTKSCKMIMIQDHEIPSHAIISCHNLDVLFEELTMKGRRIGPTIFIDECFFGSAGEYCSLFYILGLIGVSVVAYGTTRGYNSDFNRITTHHIERRRFK